MSLREKLIEAMRQGTAERTGFEPYEHIAEAALDAFLDCLAENADEWAYDPAVGDLLAVLRNSE